MSEHVNADIASLTANRFVALLPGLTHDDSDLLVDLAHHLSMTSPIPFYLICSTEDEALKSTFRAKAGSTLHNLVDFFPVTPEQTDRWNAKLVVFLRATAQAEDWGKSSALLVGHCPPNWTAALNEQVVEVDNHREHDGKAWARLLSLLIAEPSLRRHLQTPRQAADLSDIQIDGPFDSSYSLAIVNRELARALNHQGAHPVLTDPELAQRPLNRQFIRTEPELLPCAQTEAPATPGILMRNNYPPRSSDMRGALNLFTQYAWEESGYPTQWIDAFNANLHGMTVVSSLVRDVMRNNGLHIPLAICPNGVDHLTLPETLPAVREAEATFSFLHISSCFPRKGVDCLLSAWGQAFSQADPVKLIIKTFDNPHNDIADQLERHRARADYPEVELIEADYSQEQMRQLYRQADAFVAPSRAEGFGMPMAEAMMFGLPVIVTAHGGHTDFCNDDTAWLVDYRFDYSRSHLGLFSSVWAEPDINSLATQLGAVFTADPAERQRRRQNAFNKVQSLFRWNDIAQSTLNFAQSLLQAPLNIRTPKVLWVSTFNSSCGIATYSENLLCEFPRQRVQILADTASTPTGPEPENLIRCLTWGEACPEQILKQVKTHRPEAVVIQHNHAFMPLESLAQLLTELSQQGVLSFVTLHNTFVPPNSHTTFSHPGFEQATRILVHSTDDLNRLKEAGLTRNTLLFPHGVYRPAEQSNSASLKASLGLDGKRIIASFGFLMPHKGTQELITAFSRLAAEQPDLHLLLCNAQFPDEKSSRELEDCTQLIASLGLADRVTREHRFLSDEDTLQLLGMADLLVYPYQYTQESASGAVRMGITASVPVLATPLPIFKDVAPAVHFLPGTSAEAIAQGIQQALIQLQSEGRDSMTAQAEAWKAQHQWPSLSRRLLGMIKGLLLDKEAPQ
jgi:glycosyltransferase involved in cell wall biosynthesis